MKRRLWDNLLRAALGEVAGTRRGLDDLFVRHTYLTAVIGLAVQATFGIDIAGVAEYDAEGLLKGEQLRNATGPARDRRVGLLRVAGRGRGRAAAGARRWHGGLPALPGPRRRPTSGPCLYETVIPADERRQLGEYYTPAWLARAMVRELVEQPLEQRVLDPACGSGTFVVEAVAHFLDAAEREGHEPGATLETLLDAVTGVDVHPVAVHLARAAWVLAARPAIQAASDAGYRSPIAVPVYLGDALQLRYYGDLFAQRDVPVYVDDERNTVLRFPRRLVRGGQRIRRADERHRRRHRARGRPDVGAGRPRHRRRRRNAPRCTGPSPRCSGCTRRGATTSGRTTAGTWCGRWRWSKRKVDVVIGNPPWLSYRNTASTLRTALEQQSRHVYGIWAGGRYANRQDVAGLFFTRSADLYLKDGGVIGMVLPHSALQTGQYAKWRSGAWHTAGSESALTVDFGYKPAWDLERTGAKHLLPSTGVGGLCPAHRRRGQDSAPRRPGAALGWKGGCARCPARTHCHHRHFAEWRVILRRLLAARRNHRAALPVLSWTRNRKSGHCPGRPDDHR